jgi:PHP family Zn ribbon phosphoesterase
VQRVEDGSFIGPTGRRVPFLMLVPLDEVMVEALGRGPATKGARAVYDQLIAGVGRELHVLEQVTSDVIAAVAGGDAAQAVLAAREGWVTIDLGMTASMARCVPSDSQSVSGVSEASRIL